MPVAPPPLVALVGFKRSRWAPFGQVRLLTVRDGRMRVLDQHGRALVDVPVDGLSARLTPTRSVHLVWADGSAMVYGVTTQSGTPSRGIRERLAAESVGAEVLGQRAGGAAGAITVGDIKHVTRGSQAIAAALHARGAAGG
jgi:hypothetical protein